LSDLEIGQSFSSANTFFRFLRSICFIEILLLAKIAARPMSTTMLRSGGRRAHSFQVVEKPGCMIVIHPYTSEVGEDSIAVLERPWPDQV
jgi:hypothetical protein